jgi:hypothetical protein
MGIGRGWCLSGHRRDSSTSSEFLDTSTTTLPCILTTTTSVYNYNIATARVQTNEQHEYEYESTDNGVLTKVGFMTRCEVDRHRSVWYAVCGDALTPTTACRDQ